MDVCAWDVKYSPWERNCAASRTPCRRSPRRIKMAYLCFHVNGARLAPWDATLGRVPYNLTIPLRGASIPRAASFREC